MRELLNAARYAPRALPHVARLAGVAALLTLACRNAGTAWPTIGPAGRSASAANGPTEGYAVVDRPQLAPDPRPVTYHGELLEPAEHYHEHPDEFVSLVRSRGWIGYDRPRRCKGKSGCGGGNPSKKTWMRVQAIDDSHLLDLANVKPNGVLMARMMNVGPYTDSVYAFPADAPGTYTVERYVLVLPPQDVSNPTSQQKLMVLRFDAAGRPSVDIQSLSGVFHPCDRHDEPKPGFPLADFRPCPRAAGRSRADDTADRAAPDYELALAWMSCSYGCCTSEFPRR